MNEEKSLLVPEEVIMSKIYLIRDQKVMLDADLAELYEVETRRLNEQVKRNIERFPDDFMFQLTKEEFEHLKSQIATSSWGGRRKLPFAFTEHGVLMLSSVLNSNRAIRVNIQIMRIYTRIRQMMLTHKDILLRQELIEKTLSTHDDKILLIFGYLKQLEQDRQQKQEQQERKRIGFRRDGRE
ncbi:MAG TPA: ORF6N domain-containing protein [Bacteroidales bacterium]|nr:ORF6N domain-containing protein [Bacteroidales bacterium]HPM93589.1 ORF6N domain-containing protein [Bacteroidales bacterium]